MVEQHILGLIRADLEKLRDDEQMHTYIAKELQRITGHQSDALENQQRRLAELDQQSAKLRDHLLALDSNTARSMGLYDEARAITEEKTQVERRLSECSAELPTLASKQEIRTRAKVAFDQLEEVLEGGELEQKKELIALYLHRIDADPAQHRIQISIYPALFTRKIGATGRG